MTAMDEGAANGPIVALADWAARLLEALAPAADADAAG